MQAKPHLRNFDLAVALGMLAVSAIGSWLHGPGQDCVLLCVWSSENDAMSGMALELTGVGEEICLLVTVGRRLDALILDEEKRYPLGASAMASLHDRRLKMQKLGDLGDEGWVPECGEVAVLR